MDKSMAHIHSLQACRWRGLVAACVLSAISAVVHSRVPSTTTTAGPPVCEDFLAKLGHKTKGLEFVGCRPVRLYGVAALESDYRVKGAYAGPVEAYLVKTAGMPRLRFICCGWESVPRDVRGQRTYGVYTAGGRSYAVNMSSRETLVNQRSALHTVDYFYVTTVLYLEEP
jgi:Domian of unknown function (DUF4952)